MSRIEKKIWPRYFEAILNGKKKYELRLGDFDTKEGDVLVLKEWNPETKSYTGRAIEKKVTYVNFLRLSDIEKFWSRKDIEEYGLQIISLE